jgi:hypothetical protein
MSNGVFARLISKLTTPNRAHGNHLPDDHLTEDAREPETDRHLFADMLAASVFLDFGGVPADFCQARSRDFLERGAASKAEPK